GHPPPHRRLRLAVCTRSARPRLAQHHPAVHPCLCGTPAFRLPARTSARIEGELMPKSTTLTYRGDTTVGAEYRIAEPTADDVAAWWEQYSTATGDARIAIRDGL